MQIIREQDGTFTATGLSINFLMALAAALDEARGSCSRRASNCDNEHASNQWAKLEMSFDQHLQEFRYFITPEGQITDKVATGYRATPWISKLLSVHSTDPNHGKYYCSIKVGGEYFYLNRDGWHECNTTGYFDTVEEIVELQKQFAHPTK